MLPVFGSNWSSRPSRPRRVVVHARRRAGRAVTFAAILAGAAFPGILLAAGQVSPPAPRPVVVSAEVEAIIHPVSAEYMVDVLERADARGAALVVFTLKTPGGLVDSTRTIITKMLAAKTPVVVFVGPAGARAASAGFLLTIAADVAAMAPGTHIGAAHPVTGDGQKMDETTAKKAASDVAAYARSLATQRGRNIELSEAAVQESRAFTEKEALEATPPLIDLVASDVMDLLAKLDGRTIKRFDGREVVLHTAGALVESVQMNWRQRVLSALAHPNIAYLLLSLGILGLTVELWNPGAVLPGVAGGICLLLAFFTLQVLPVNYAGVLLILFGITLLVLEVKVASYGLLSAGGIISLLLGSMILIDSPVPELRVSLSLILPVVGGLAAILIFLVRLGVASQMRRPATGAEGMVGGTGVVKEPITPEAAGRVATHGEIWTATADEVIAGGEDVEVVAVEGLRVKVKRRVSR